MCRMKGDYRDRGVGACPEAGRRGDRVRSCMERRGGWLSSLQWSPGVGAGE